MTLILPVEPRTVDDRRLVHYVDASASTYREESTPDSPNDPALGLNASTRQHTTGLSSYSRGLKVYYFSQVVKPFATILSHTAFCLVLRYLRVVPADLATLPTLSCYMGNLIFLCIYVRNVRDASVGMGTGGVVASGISCRAVMHEHSFIKMGLIAFPVAVLLWPIIVALGMAWRGEKGRKPGSLWSCVVLGEIQPKSGPALENMAKKGEAKSERATCQRIVKQNKDEMHEHAL